MTSFHLHLDPSESVETATSDADADAGKAGATRVDLRWAPGRVESNIECLPAFFRDWRPSPPAEDLLLLAPTAFCVDKFAARRASADAWTRTLQIEVPVGEPDRFARAGLAETLGFLSGDHWDFDFATSTARPLDFLPAPLDLPESAPIDLVSLFSGGLDSLCGVIDLLEADPSTRIGLVGYHDGGQATSRQELLYQRLADHYGAHRVPLHQLWLRPAPPRPEQQYPTPAPVERTTRARSFLFVTAALALASSAGPDVEVVIPENGYIALNVPLTRARTSSASTRTTHPHFLAGLQRVARSVGIDNPLQNPYRYTTKGEMLTSSRNPALLQQLAPLSVSCSHPEAARMQQRTQGNCGYCFPCIIRRASMAAAGWDDASHYPWDALSDDELLRRTDLARGADLRAVVNGIYTPRRDVDLVRNAPLPAGSHAQHLSTWRRGNAEIRNWLEDGASGLLASTIGPLQ